MDVARLDALIEARRRALDIPGLALAVVDRGGMVYARGFGVTGVGNGGLPVAPDTVFRVASVTKMLVGTAILRLVEAGRLNLDVPVTRYVPWLRFSQEGMEDRITLGHLLSHTSGLCTWRGDFMSRDPDGLERFARECLPTYPFLVPPDVAWVYSNAGIALAAYVAESVAGMPFRALMDELVFAPLAMTRTTFDPLVGMAHSFAQAHIRDAAGGMCVDPTFAMTTPAEPGAGAMSTAADLARVAELYLNAGAFRGRRLLAPESVGRMWTPRVALWTARDEGYGLTFATEVYKGLSLVRHNGGGLASYGACFYLAPVRGIGVIALANWPAVLPVVRAVFDELFVLSAEEPRRHDVSAGAEPDRDARERYAGTYEGAYTGLAEVRVEDDGPPRLILTLNGREFVLRAIRARHYLGAAAVGRGEVAVGFPAAGDGDDPRQQRWIVVNDGPCERVEAPGTAAPDSGRWAAYAGTYRLPEAALVRDADITVDVRDGALWMTRGGVARRCLPLGGGRFACDDGLLAFHECDGEVTLEMWRTMTARRAGRSA